MSDRRLSLCLALCVVTLAACGGGGTPGLGTDPGVSPLATSAAPTAGTPTSAAASATARTHPAAHATTAAPTHAATSAPRAVATSRPTAVKTSAKPKPTSTSAGPAACANNTSSTSLAMVNSGAEYAFSPTSVTVTCGGVVHVTNNSTYDHTMSPNSGGFSDSGDVAPTMSADVRFSYRGTYGFYCSIHTYMTGTVKVT